VIVMEWPITMARTMFSITVGWISHDVPTKSRARMET
jgi:hypothetical protein